MFMRGPSDISMRPTGAYYYDKVDFLHAHVVEPWWFLGRGQVETHTRHSDCPPSFLPAASLHERSQGLRALPRSTRLGTG